MKIFKYKNYKVAVYDASDMKEFGIEDPNSIGWMPYTTYTKFIEHFEKPRSGIKYRIYVYENGDKCRFDYFNLGISVNKYLETYVRHTTKCHINTWNDIYKLYKEKILFSNIYDGSDTEIDE